jgi:hypothetical protein
MLGGSIQVSDAAGRAGLTPLVQVFDMPTSVRFYRDVLGFEVVSTSEYWAEAVICAIPMGTRCAFSGN